MPRRDLSKQLGEQRSTTQHKVEVQDPMEAAKAALHQGSSSTQEGQQESTQAGTPTSEQTRLPTDQRTRMHARTQEVRQERKPSSGETSSRKAITLERLYDHIQQRKHLSNGSFRYRAEELENMDAIFRELEALKPGRISKNDIARMALVTLCHDYQENGEGSVLAQVFKRM
jgi:hypothetical protein